MTERVRFLPKQHNLDSHRLPEFLNPFDYMSSDDARVTVELYDRNVPFSYRYFDGADQAPTIHKLMPDFAPEFTLSDYKTVIMVEGGFFGTLPGVLDKAALAKTLLQHDGWKVIILFENDIMHNLVAILNQEFPESVHPLITGGEKPSPFAPPHYLFTKRQFLRGLALLKEYVPKHPPRKPRKDIQHGDHVRSTRTLRRVGGDGGRYRPLSQRYRNSSE